MKQFWQINAERLTEIKPVHGHLYFYILNLANTCGWPNKLGLPTDYTMTMCGISSYKTYKKAIDDLIEFGLIKVEFSKSRHQSNVVTLVLNSKVNIKVKSKVNTIEEPLKVSDNNTINTINTDKNNKDVIVGDESPNNEKDIWKNKEKYSEQTLDEFERFNRYIDENLPNVRKIKNQISLENYYQLRLKYKMDVILDKLMNIHNTPKYHSGKERKEDVYYTILSWIRNDEKKSPKKNIDELDFVKRFQKNNTPDGIANR